MPDYKRTNKTDSTKQCKQCNQHKSTSEYSSGRGVCKVCFAQKTKEKRNSNYQSSTDNLALLSRILTESFPNIKSKIVFQIGKRKITIEEIEDIEEIEETEDIDNSVDSTNYTDPSILLSIVNSIHNKGLSEYKLTPTEDEVQVILEDQNVLESIAKDTGISVDEIPRILTKSFLRSKN